MKFFFLFFLLCSQAMAATSLEEKLSAAYQEREDHGDLVGLAIGVINPEATSEFKFGEATQSSKAFEIGSISKTFTGIALGKLASENKLDIHAPISIYIPELKYAYAGNLTVAQIGTHRGKLVRSLNVKATEGNLISFLQTYIPEENFPAYSYSNMGFAVLALIIERVSHRSYADYIRENIFDLLGMRDSGFLFSEDDFSRIITPHNLINEITVYDVLDDLSVGSGGIYSPLKDMIKFLGLNMRPEEFPSLKGAVEISQKNRLGWDHKEGDKLHWKNGSMPGFTSFFGIRTDIKTGTISLNNTCHGKVTQDMALIALGWDYPLVKELPPSLEFKKTYLGTYYLAGDDYRFEVVERNGGHLGIRVVRPDGSLDYVLKILSYDGISFKLATAWQGYENVVFGIESETGKIFMKIISEDRTDIYHK